MILESGADLVVDRGGNTLDTTTASKTSRVRLAFVRKDSGSEYRNQFSKSSACRRLPTVQAHQMFHNLTRRYAYLPGH